MRASDKIAGLSCIGSIIASRGFANFFGWVCAVAAEPGGSQARAPFRKLRAGSVLQIPYMRGPQPPGSPGSPVLACWGGGPLDCAPVKPSHYSSSTFGLARHVLHH